MNIEDIFTPLFDKHNNTDTKHCRRYKKNARNQTRYIIIWIS